MTDPIDLVVVPGPGRSARTVSLSRTRLRVALAAVVAITGALAWLGFELSGRLWAGGLP